MATHNQQHEVDPDNTDEIAMPGVDRMFFSSAASLPKVDLPDNSRLDLFLAGEIDEPHQELD
jgi:hypothetical protein